MDENKIIEVAVEEVKSIGVGDVASYAIGALGITYACVLTHRYLVKPAIKLIRNKLQDAKNRKANEAETVVVIE